MALSANTVWEVRTTGSDTNGGGFVAGASGTDWSQQAAAQYAVTDAVTNGTTTITSATANFGTDVIGNILYIQGGTGAVTAGWYQITGRTNSTTITVDRSTGLTTGTGATLNIGGALVTLKRAIDNCVSSNFVWLRAGTYSTGTAIAVNNSASSLKIEGYNTTRGDGASTTRPVLQATAAILVWTLNNFGVSWVRHIDFDGNSTGTTGLRVINFGGGGATTQVLGCTFRSFTGTGFETEVGGPVINCEAYSNSRGFGAIAGGSGIRAINCIARNNTNQGFYRLSGTFDFCLAYSNGGDGFHYFGNGDCSFTNCVSYSNTGDGFGDGDGSGRQIWFQNCISYGNSAFGFAQAAANTAFMRNCAYGSNTSGTTSNVTNYAGGVSLSGNPFTNAGSGDFSLNNTAGAGAACRAAGFPGVLPGGTTTGYIDIGAAQHQETASGGSAVIIRRSSVLSKM